MFWLNLTVVFVIKPWDDDCLGLPGCSDLHGIPDDIEDRNSDVALTTYRLITGSVSPIDQHPFIGRVAGTRELIINGMPYMIAYDIGDQILTIIAVLHISRQWPDGFLFQA
jgi:addiction module RelE/StbE family toxin